MGEILEKGLMIGFGLIIMTLFLSSINPMISLLINPFPSNDLNNINNFGFIINYGINYYSEEPEEVLSFNITLNNPVSIRNKEIEDKNYILIESQVKNITLNTEQSVKIDFLSVNGSFTLEFHYTQDLITIKKKVF